MEAKPVHLRVSASCPRGKMFVLLCTHSRVHARTRSSICLFLIFQLNKLDIYSFGVLTAEAIALVRITPEAMITEPSEKRK